VSEVHSPSHYKAGDIECIDGIEAALGLQGAIDYCRGNVIKYTWRCRYKGHTVTDLNKAAWYCKKAAELAAKVDKTPTYHEESNLWWHSIEGPGL